MSQRPDVHPDELLQELIDGRLHGEDRAAVESHLGGCPRCQRLRKSLLAARRVLREAPSEPLSPELIASLRRAVVEDAAARAATTPGRPAGGPSARAWRVAAGIAAALLVLLASLVLRWGAPTDLVDELAALHAVETPAFAERDAAALEVRLAAALPFRARVLDLAMMEMQLIGGGPGTVGGSPAASMIYTAPGGGRLLCVMWRGRLEDLPPAEGVRHRPPFTFRVYRRGHLTIVGWQEGELVCALVGSGDPAAVIAMAMGKAMLPARGSQSG